MKEKLLKYYLDNPCLSEPIDYLDDTCREKIYREQLSNLSEKDAREIYESLTGYSEQ